MVASDLVGRLAARALGFAAAATLAVLAPRIAWWAKPARTLEVVIVDKTVPFRNMREHAAIPWILHAQKIENGLGRFLDPTRDYVGFDPIARAGRDLVPADVAYADVLFLADTYGVYVGDYRQSGDQAALERSPKIYGGLSDDEAKVIDHFASRGGMVIGEFNTFASPTEDVPRARLEARFGVRWTKWVARYWPNLQDPNEVPRWVGRVYEHVTGRPYDLTGGGLVFVREDTDIAVLRNGEDLGPGVVTQERLPAGTAFGFPERGGFRYWMDILVATDAEVLYEHVVDATPAGARSLAAHGLPRRFPALTKLRDVWYFAGDFVDNSLDLGNPELAALLAYREERVGCSRGATLEESFFWGWYVPIVSRLLASRAR
jgi:hypothetical protein